MLVHLTHEEFTKTTCGSRTGAQKLHQFTACKYNRILGYKKGIVNIFVSLL